MRVYSFDSKEVIPLRRCVIASIVNGKGIIVSKKDYTICKEVRSLGYGYFAYATFGNLYTIVDSNGKKYYENFFSEIFDKFKDERLRVYCKGNSKELKDMNFGFFKGERYNDHSTLSRYCNYLKPDMTFVSNDWFNGSDTGNFSEGYAVVHGFDGNFYYIDKNGKNVFDEKIRYPYINAKGEKYIVKSFGYSEPFENGVAKVQHLHEYAHNLINKKGNLLIKEYPWPHDFKENKFVNGFLRVDRYDVSNGYRSETNLEYNYVNRKTGKYLSKIWFKDAKDFKKDGFAKVLKLWRLYIDNEGNYHTEKKKGYHNKGVIASYIDKYGNLYDEDKNPLPDKFIEFLNKK